MSKELNYAAAALEAAKVNDRVIIDLTNSSQLDKLGVQDSSGVIQGYVNRALNDYKVTGRNPGSVTFSTVELILPRGQYLIDKTIVIDCSMANNQSVSDTITLHIKGGGGGPSGTVISIGPNATQMFDMKYGQIIMEGFKFFGKGTAIFAKVGRPQREKGTTNALGDVMLKQSHFRDCEWYYWNKVFEVGHMFDVKFDNCGFFNFGGTSPVAFDVLKHAEDPTNNIMFYRCHLEQLPGGVFLRSIGGTGSLQHNNYGFFGCHFEARNWDTTLIELEHTHRVGFYNTQFTHNNTQGETRGVTEAQIAPMFKFRNSSSIQFNNCTITRQQIGNQAIVANKLFELGASVCGVMINGGIVDPNADATSINDLWQSSETAPYISNGESPLLINGPLVDPRYPPMFPDKMTLASPTARSRKWGIRHTTANELEFGYSLATDKNFDYTDYGMKLTTEGVLSSTSIAGKKKTVANAATATWNIPSTGNASRRGIFSVWATHNSDCFALFFSDGANLFPMFVGSTASVSTAEGSVAGKLNIYLGASSNITVKNLLGSNRDVVLKHEGI
ncbi:hypothetical protein [Paenibacillus pabuli]|uniref:hypothetical protein n=1 Tax=Paenibacillus pabuli TaxID=1472 RepID=UPI001FFFA722|nr:hypothetical protein [Paenibacillus pabuli]UPK45872.1 hypothetical protein KET34_10645 [Paenibacillus pabuli]